MIFCRGSCSREFIITGRIPASIDCSASRAERLAERTAAKVATASTSVPAPVASSEIVAAQSVTY